MYRSLAVLALLFFISDVEANGPYSHRHSHVRYGAYPNAWSMGIPVYPGSNPSFGFGTTYDPYSTGRFVAPDLLNDPYYLHQHRYPSHSKRRPPLQFKHPY